MNATHAGMFCVLGLLFSVTAAAEALQVKAHLSPTTPGNFACATQGRYYLRFDLEWAPPDAVKPDDQWRVAFRDLFTGKVLECNPKADPKGGGRARIVVTPDVIALPPSSYHVRLEPLRSGQSLCGPQAGSCELYVAREGESANHVLGSFFLSRVAYTWDEEHKLHWRNIPKLPPSGDPFDPAGRATFAQAVKADLQMHPELKHDGGVAFLHGAEVFRKLGEMDRAAFCEQVLKRTIEEVLTIMLAEDGRLYARKWDGKTAKPIYHIRQQDGFVLKLLSQSYLYFRTVARDKAYANDLFRRMQPMVKYQFSQPNPLGCGGSGCKVYDGRILAGLAYYCHAERAATGELNEEHVATTLKFAREAAAHCLAHRGWYDNDCYKEGKCHIGFGTQNIMCGLLPSRRLALLEGDQKLAEYLGDAAVAGFDFLARTNGKITGEIQWIPSRHSQWANGNMHEILDELRAQKLGRSDMLDWYYAKLWQPAYGFWVLAFHRCDILATPLLECAEYKQALER